jgi:hypothetical protein
MAIGGQSLAFLGAQLTKRKSKRIQQLAADADIPEAVKQLLGDETVEEITLSFHAPSSLVDFITSEAADQGLEIDEFLISKLGLELMVLVRMAEMRIGKDKEKGSSPTKRLPVAGENLDDFGDDWDSGSGKKLH